MFAATAGEVYRESFCVPFRFSELIPAQPRCVFGNDDHTASPHSGARSERVAWILSSESCFCDAGRLTTHPSLLLTRSPEDQVNVTQGLEAKPVLRPKEHCWTVFARRDLLLTRAAAGPARPTGFVLE